MRIGIESTCLANNTFTCQTLFDDRREVYLLTYARCLHCRELSWISLTTMERAVHWIRLTKEQTCLSMHEWQDKPRSRRSRWITVEERRGVTRRVERVARRYLPVMSITGIDLADFFSFSEMGDGDEDEIVEREELGEDDDEDEDDELDLLLLLLE